jgi:hypothetical protein
MAYRVDISPSALADAEAAYLKIKELSSPASAGQWYEGLLKAIFSLENFPLRCPIAPESKEIGKELRQLLYGKRGRIYKIFFATARDEQSGEDVCSCFSHLVQCAPINHFY